MNNSVCVCNLAESDIKTSVHPQKSPKERVHRAGVKSTYKLSIVMYEVFTVMSIYQNGKSSH